MSLKVLSIMHIIDVIWATDSAAIALQVFLRILNFPAIERPLGSVSSRECLDAPAILATLTAGRTGLVQKGLVIV